MNPESAISLYAIVVAAGAGSRIGAELPKQFLPLGNNTIIETCLSNLASVFSIKRTVIVLPEMGFDEWHSKLSGRSNTFLTRGGSERAISVASGLAALLQHPVEENAYILVHDAARPFVSPEVAANIKSAIVAGHSVIVPCISEKDSVRRTLPDGSSHSVDRNTILRVQTPQALSLEAMRKIYLQGRMQMQATDDAGAAEALGYSVHTVEGSENLFKITTPIDLRLAEILAGDVLK